MKQSPSLDKAQENMRPGVMTLEGFLGRDDRNLIDIIIDDDGAVKRLGLSHEQIALAMTSLRDRGMAGLGEFVSVGPHFEVRVDSVRGKLPCPFEHPGLYPKTNITVRNLASGREVTFTDLHIHLINEHGFYEGRGSAFRIEPADIAAVLEVVPEE